MILGACSCFFTVVGITWIQKQTPSEMLGRVMSLGMFASLFFSDFFKRNVTILIFAIDNNPLSVDLLNLLNQFLVKASAKKYLLNYSYALVSHYLALQTKHLQHHKVVLFSLVLLFLIVFSILKSRFEKAEGLNQLRV